MIELARVLGRRPVFRERAAKLRVRDFLRESRSEEVIVRKVDRLPTQPYGFNPEGWLLFEVSDSHPTKLQGSRFIAVNEQGEVRDLGILGD